MTRIKIYGSSDDLICIDGDFRGEAGGPGYVELSTGDVFYVDYDGCWNVEHVRKSDKVQIEIFRKEEEDDDGYTGHAIVSGDIKWIDFWRDWPHNEEEMRERLADNLEGLSAEGLIRAYYDACHGV